MAKASKLNNLYLIKRASVESGNRRLCFVRLEREHVLALPRRLLRRLQLLLVLDGDEQRVQPLGKLERRRLGRFGVDLLRRPQRRLQEVELRDDGDDRVGDGPAERTQELVLVDVETRRMPVPVSLSVGLDDVVEEGSPAGHKNGSVSRWQTRLA